MEGGLGRDQDFVFITQEKLRGFDPERKGSNEKATSNLKGRGPEALVLCGKAGSPSYAWTRLTGDTRETARFLNENREKEPHRKNRQSPAELTWARSTKGEEVSQFCRAREKKKLSAINQV